MVFYRYIYKAISILGSGIAKHDWIINLIIIVNIYIYIDLPYNFVIWRKSIFIFLSIIYCKCNNIEHNSHIDVNVAVNTQNTRSNYFRSVPMECYNTPWYWAQQATDNAASATAPPPCPLPTDEITGSEYYSIERLQRLENPHKLNPIAHMPIGIMNMDMFSKYKRKEFPQRFVSITSAEQIWYSFWFLYKWSFQLQGALKHQQYRRYWLVN